MTGLGLLPVAYLEVQEVDPLVTNVTNINDKKCSVSTVLTATRQIKKRILPSIVVPTCQRDAE